MDLMARVAANIREHSLIDASSDVLVAVSGGVDSMALLQILHRLAGGRLQVAHFNHCLRGTESDADETFVREAAHALNIPFYSGRADVNSLAREQGISIEMAARELRHRFLIETAGQHKIERIALAHHADDNVETFWLRLLRGDAGPGLAGIRWIRPAGAGTPIYFVRPLLNILKVDMLKFARKEQIAHREDASNEDKNILRNRVRLELIPRLETFQPALREVTARTINILSAEKDFLEKEARSWLRARPFDFDELHPALQREIVRVQLLEGGEKPNFDLIEHLRLNPETAISVAPERAVKRSVDGMVTAVRHHEIDFSEAGMALILNETRCADFLHLEVEWEFVTQRGSAAHQVEYFDADAVGSVCTLRCWRPGDRFRPIGMAHEAKLQDLLTNLKLPSGKKRRRILACDESGRIFWVQGLRISECHKVQPSSRRVLQWSWRERSRDS